MVFVSQPDVNRNGPILGVQWQLQGKFIYSLSLKEINVKSLLVH